MLLEPPPPPQVGMEDGRLNLPPSFVQNLGGWVNTLGVSFFFADRGFFVKIAIFAS